MIGVKAEMCEGRWVESRWATGALFPEFVRRYLVGGDQ
jgi:hypothetical protein